MKTAARQKQASSLETRLNLLLRRADWRFFLPNPQPGVSLNLAKGLLGQAVQEISGRVVDPTKVQPGECDLAVAVDPDHAQLRSIYEALAPGGGFYSEWYRPFSGSPDRIRRKLEAAGFTAIQSYWPWPLPNYKSPVFWLPLDQAEPLAYFLATRPKPSSFRQKVTNLLLRWTWRALYKARLLFPVCVAAQKPPVSSPSQSPVMRVHPSRRFVLSRGLLASIRTDYHQFGFQEKPEHLDWLLLTGGQRRVSKVVAPVFVRGEKTPRFILKMNRVPETRERLVNEARILKTIQTGELQDGLPDLLFSLKYEGVSAIAQSICTGQPVYTLLSRETYSEIARSVSAWLAQLAKKTWTEPQPGQIRSYLNHILADYHANYAEIISPGELETCRSQFKQLEHLPLVCEHRDCTPWNWIRSADGNYSLLDWEDATLSGLPGVDLIFFLNYLALFFQGTIDEGDFLATYRKAQDPTTFTGKIHAACVHQYFSELGLNPALLAPLRLFTWTQHANRQYQRHILAFAAPPGLDWIQKKFYPNFWKMEVTQGAFPGWK